jgi:hypothetical protein
MNAFERFFHSEHGASRAYLFSKVFLLMLALDTWMLMIGHAGRYGVAGFNVAHFAWLDAIQPTPTASSYVAVLVLTGLLSLVILLTGIRRSTVFALFVLYTFSWSMSMLDSYQHHYFVSLILLCFVFFPQTSALELRKQKQAKPLLRPGSGFSLLGATVTVVYTFTAIAKMDAQWLAGHTMRQISSAERVFAPLADYAGSLGVEREHFWSLLATAVIPQELLLALCYLFAVHQDRLASRIPRVLCAVGFVLAVVLHVGAEAMGLQIGWFSYYMLLLACCFLLPLPVVDRLAIVFAWPARWLMQQTLDWEAESPPSKLASLGLAFGCALLLMLVGKMIDLPGALPACALAGLALVIVTLLVTRAPQPHDPRRYAVATAIASAMMWLAIAVSPVRWDFYRYLGGDLNRRGEPEAALEAYLKGERYAPPGESRMKQIKELRRKLAR